MTQRVGVVVLAILALLLGAAAASADTMDERKREIDQQIAGLRDKITAADAKEAVLTEEISAVTSRIRALQHDVDRARARVATLEEELIVYKNKLAGLTQILELQKQKLELLREQHRIAEKRLADRLVAIYQADDPVALEVVLSARSFADLLDQLDYVAQLGRQDRSIASQVEQAKIQIRKATTKTFVTRREVQAASREVEARTIAQRAERDRLVSSQNQLASARTEKRRTLAAVEATEDDLRHEVEILERESAELAARITAAQVGSTGSPTIRSGSGVFVWPVNGVLTSGYGPRWGRMHEGIDIAAPAGTPIHAAAAGTVIIAGWMGGYGNLVVVDHGGGLATAYGHQSSFAVGVGQQVAAGQTIGYVGSTGHSTGNHLHFEVRVNGAAVDPMGYL